jgi:hypothetical protein
LTVPIVEFVMKVCSGGVAVGAVASIVRLSALEAEEVFPAASFAVAVMEWLPSLRALLGVKLQLPALSAVLVPSEVLPS